MEIKILNHSDNYKTITESLIGGTIKANTTEYVNFIYNDIEYNINYTFIFYYSWNTGIIINDIKVNNNIISMEVLYDVVNKICLKEKL